jgi:hypothetical protein
MAFQLLLNFLSFMIGLTARNNRAIKEMLTTRDRVYVIKTKDGKYGRRFIIKDGKYSSDTVLQDYELAFIFKDADTGFKTLALGGDTGLQIALNNYDMKLDGNPHIFNFFGVLIAVSMGMMKRKEIK